MTGEVIEMEAGMLGTSELLDRVLNGPIGQKVRAEAAADLLAKRQAIAADWRQLNAQMAKEAPQWAKRELAATERAEQARAKYVEASDAAASVAAERRSAQAGLEAQIRAAEAQLIATCDQVAIDRAVADLDAMDRELCQRPLVREPAVRDHLTGRWVGGRSNYEAVSAALATIRQLRRDLPALRLEALSESDLQARLAAIGDEAQRAVAATMRLDAVTEVGA